MLQKIWYIIAFSVVIVSIFLGYFSDNDTLKVIVLITGCSVMVILRIIMYVLKKRQMKEPPA